MSRQAGPSLIVVVFSLPVVSHYSVVANVIKLSRFFETCVRFLSPSSHQKRPQCVSRATAAVQVSVQFHTRCGAGTAAPPSLCTHTRTADLNAVKKLKKSLRRNNRMEAQRRACERCCYLHTELYILTLTPHPSPSPNIYIFTHSHSHIALAHPLKLRRPASGSVPLLSFSCLPPPPPPPPAPAPPPLSPACLAPVQL